MTEETTSKYAVALFSEKVMPDRTKQYLHVEIVDAINSEEALGMVMVRNDRPNKDYAIVFFTTKWIEE